MGRTYSRPNRTNAFGKSINRLHDKKNRADIPIEMPARFLYAIESSPGIGQAECQHFLKLEVAPVVFRQGHTIVEPGMEEKTGGQITAQLEIKRILPIQRHLAICGKEIELGIPRDVVTDFPIHLDRKFGTEDVGTPAPFLHLER